jgi:hypothetical protein
VEYEVELEAEEAEEGFLTSPSLPAQEPFLQKSEPLELRLDLCPSLEGRMRPGGSRANGKSHRPRRCVSGSESVPVLGSRERVGKVFRSSHTLSKSTAADTSLERVSSLRRVTRNSDCLPPVEGVRVESVMFVGSTGAGRR